MVDIKRQAANFTVDGLYVVSDIFARMTIKHLFFRANHSKAFTQVLYCLSFCSEPLGH